MRTFRRFKEVFASLPLIGRIHFLTLVGLGLSAIPLGIFISVAIHPLIGIPYIVLMVVALRTLVNGGWRWRVRDGNRSPWEQQVVPAPQIIEHVPWRDLWGALAPSGRRQFGFRCGGFALFVVGAAVVGFSNGVIVGVIAVIAAIAVVGWFLRWVHSYVEVHGRGTDPWADP